MVSEREESVMTGRLGSKHQHGDRYRKLRGHIFITDRKQRE